MSGHIFSLRVFRIIWWVSVASRHFICSITCAKGDVILQQTASNLCHGSRLSGMPGAPIHDTFFWDHSAFTLTASFVSDYTSESVTCPSEYARPSSKISGTFMWQVEKHWYIFAIKIWLFSIKKNVISYYFKSKYFFIKYYFLLGHVSWMSENSCPLIVELGHERAWDILSVLFQFLRLRNATC